MGNSASFRVGIVGCGYQGNVIANALARVPSLQLAGCTDSDEAAAAKLAAQAQNVVIYSSTEEMLEQGNVDIVVVATPHHLLYENALAAIHAGKHVLAEKPIGMDEKEAIQLEEAVRQTGVSFLAGYSFRYLPAWQQVHALLQQGAVGEIQSIAGSIGTRPFSPGWKSNPETGGGSLLFVGCHLVDQILWYLNDTPTEVYADVRYCAETRTDETSAFQIKFAGGATAQCLSTQKGDSFFSNLDIYGSEGRIRLNYSGFLTYTIEMTSRVLPTDTHLGAMPPQQDDDPRMVKHTAQLQEFVQAIQEKRQPAVGIEDGRRVLKVLDGVIKSSRSGGPIRIR